MAIWLILAATAVYVGLLFLVAWQGDRMAARTRRPVRPVVYALALAVYCTSWTFYGAVGTAAESGWDYLPIYLGPALVFLLAPDLVRRIGDVAQRESVTSLSDFLAARYGKSRLLAAVATLAAVAGSLPYIALQLKSVGMSFEALADPPGDGSQDLPVDTMLATALLLALFAILFGARNADTTRRNAGLMRALALESLVKLVALGAVCVLSLSLLGQIDPSRLAEARVPFDVGGPVGGFLTLTLLSMAAILCLPRQFHIAVIERGRSDDVRTAAWLFPLYLALTSLVVIPITLAGGGLLPADVPPDLFVLALPLSEGNTALALLVFLGGFSAATGMVIVSSVALSTMVTNDLIVPTLMRFGRLKPDQRDIGTNLVRTRRAVILILLLLAYAYSRSAGSQGALAQIGLLSFAAAAQFAPGLIGAVYWRGGHRIGVLAGLIAGMALWIYTLLMPALLGSQAVAALGLTGPLAPYRLLGFDLGDPLSHGTLWSLGANLALYVLVSLRMRDRLRDRIQAAVFTGREPVTTHDSLPASTRASGTTPDGLRALAERFLSPEAVAETFRRHGDETGQPVSGDQPADWGLVQQTERLLARAIGASSARVVLSSALAGGAVDLRDVLAILDQQTQAERFDRHMLQSMLEHIGQGISVVDGQQRLVAWNSTYVEMFRYPPHLVHLGRPISDLIAYNIAQGWIQGEGAENEIRRRVDHMRAGRPHVFERQNPDGTWLRITGSPMPGGGYVTAFTDITEDKRREQALMELTATLEARVDARTEDLRVMAADLDSARQEAEQANASKTRFLAAASHDLLQPLNAARLFLGALASREAGSDPRELIAKTDRAIESADQLLRGLLDMTRLDQGTITAKPAVLPAGPVMEDLVEEALPMARAAGLDLRLAPTSLSVRADPDFLQSILRNFLSNARRYTRHGRILIGARRRRGRVRFEVWDTGPGIAEARQDAIFEAFRRLADTDNAGVRGAGLGLAIARRMADLMQARIGVRSIPGRGSVFWLEVPRAHALRVPDAKTPARAASDATTYQGLRVLCVDDEPAILDAMAALLDALGCRALIALDREAALRVTAEAPADLAFLDLKLADGDNGIEVHDLLRAAGRIRGGAALLTATLTEAARQTARARGMDMLEKPVDPDRLRDLLARLARRRDLGDPQAAE